MKIRNGDEEEYESEYDEESPEENSSSDKSSSEGTILHIFEDCTHIVFDALIKHAWTGDVVTIFSGVRN